MDVEGRMLQEQWQRRRKMREGATSPTVSQKNTQTSTKSEVIILQFFIAFVCW